MTGEEATIQRQNRIVLALIAVFASLVGLPLAILGQVFDDDGAFLCGSAIAATSIAGVVALLNMPSKGER